MFTPTSFDILHMIFILSFFRATFTVRSKQFVQNGVDKNRVFENQLEMYDQLDRQYLKKPEDVKDTADTAEQTPETVQKNTGHYSVLHNKSLFCIRMIRM